MKKFFIKKKKVAEQCKECMNRYSGCWKSENTNKCVRFLPEHKTNLTNIDGVIITPPEVDSDAVSQVFINWIESLGWQYCGSFRPYEEENNGG